MGKFLLQFMASYCMMWCGHSSRGVIFPALLFSSFLPTFAMPVLEQLGVEHKSFTAGMNQQIPTRSMEHSKQWEPWCTAAWHGPSLHDLLSTSMRGLLPESIVRSWNSLWGYIHCFLSDHIIPPGWSLQSSNAMWSHVWSLLHTPSHPLPLLLFSFFFFLTLVSAFFLFPLQMSPYFPVSNLILPLNVLVKKWCLLI